MSYTDQSEGVIRNEGCGQISAWYIISALGFYQVNPSSSVFVLGSPSFNKVSVYLPEDKALEIVTQNNNEENIYIQSALLNDKPHNNSYTLCDDTVGRGNLTLVMGNMSNKEFGATPESHPKTVE